MNPIVRNGNKLKWKFDNVKDLTEERVYSDKLHTDMIDWKIYISTSNERNTTFLSLGLCYDSDNKYKKNRICEVEAKFKLMKRGGKSEDKLKRCFLATPYIYRFDTFMMMSTVMNENNGYLFDNSIYVEIDFSFKYYDFSKKVPNVTDIIINVQDTEFHLNKWALCSKSEYFNDLILNAKPNETEVIKLDDVKTSHFCYMLASFDPFFDTNLDRHYADFVILAKRFGVPSLHYKCEQYLINETKLELIDKIKYADENDYEGLMKECIESLKTAFDVKKFQADPKFSGLKESTKLRIMKISISTNIVATKKCLSISFCYDNDNKNEKNWICEVDANLKLLKKPEKPKETPSFRFVAVGSPVNSSDIEKPVRKIQRCFLENPSTWEISKFLSWSTLSSEYMFGNSIYVEVDLSFKYYDFSKKIPNFTDITVNVEDTEFHLNNWVLGSSSNYFYDLIMKNESNIIKLEDIKHANFCYMLASFDPFFETNLDYNYAELIELAKKLNVPTLHQKVEQYLIKDAKIGMMDKVKLADENDYERLLKKCIESLNSGFDVQKLQADPQFSGLKESTKLRIMYRCLDFF